jgi:hypothetical protein
MKLEDRIRAIAEFGFTERQARFLDVVMLFGGLCVPRQYAAFAGTAYGHRVSRLFDKLVQRGYAAVCDCLHNRAELYHVRHHALYLAINQPHSRYRRPVPARQVVDRLMRLDTIVLQPELIWLATDEEEVALFSLMAPSFPRERLPHLVVGQGAGRRLRLFPEDQPIGVTTNGSRGFHVLGHRLRHGGAPGLRPTPRRSTQDAAWLDPPTGASAAARRCDSSFRGRGS